MSKTTELPFIKDLCTIVNNYLVKSHSLLEQIKAEAVIFLTNDNFKVRSWLEYDLYSLDAATKNGYLSIVQLMHSQRPDLFITNSYILGAAAEHGHLHIVKWLHYNCPKITCPRYAMDYAAYHGHFNVVRWLHYNRTEGCSWGAINLAAERGHFKIVKWLHYNCKDNIYGVGEPDLDEAARNGHFEIVKWMYANCNATFSINAIDYTREAGHNDITDWLVARSAEECLPLGD